jgi:hypothetical protein
VKRRCSYGEIKSTRSTLIADFQDEIKTRSRVDCSGCKFCRPDTPMCVRCWGVQRFVLQTLTFLRVTKLPMPGLPKSWIDRRRRKLRREQRDALARIGLSTAGSPAVGETTVCIAYMCPWAHACNSATPRPALVAERDCLRKFPEERRPDSGLSDVALDNLAKQREDGIRLETVTMTVLDEFRPGGPTPSLNQKRPARPVYESGVMGRPFPPRPLIQRYRDPERSSGTGETEEANTTATGSS